MFVTTVVRYVEVVKTAVLLPSFSIRDITVLYPLKNLFLEKSPFEKALKWTLNPLR